MAYWKRIRNLISQDNSGFGTNATNSGRRFFDRRSGSALVQRRGVGFLSKYSWYHTMLGMPTGRFLLLLFTIYISVNFLFAGIYYIIGVEHLAGIEPAHNWKEFSDVFFFSTQTFTTVGYGRISPSGFWASAVATLEAFLGLLSFAIATGLFYGRFSRPRAFLRFSQQAIIAPYKGGLALMFRMAPYKNNVLSEAEVTITLAMQVDEDGKPVNKFFTLDTEIVKINSLALSWTVVHAINEKSPLADLTRDELPNTRIEAMVYVRAFDEVFSNTVVARWSYLQSEIRWGARYRMMYHASANRETTVLDLRLLDAMEEVPLPDGPAFNSSPAGAV